MFPALLGLIIGTPLLMLTLKIFKIKSNWMTAFQVVGIQTVISFVFGLIPFLPGFLSFIVSLIVVTYLIKIYYKLEWDKAIALSLVWIIMFTVILNIVIRFVLILVGAVVLSTMIDKFG